MRSEKAYEKGIQKGAPQAIQIADRFHLLQNLAQTLNQVFNAYGEDLKAVEKAYSIASVTQKDGITVVPVPRPPLMPREQRLAQQRRQRRLEIYNQVWFLHAPCAGLEMLLLVSLVLVTVTMNPDILDKHLFPGIVVSEK